jgi:hypothetical protein
MSPRLGATHRLRQCPFAQKGRRRRSQAEPHGYAVRARRLGRKCRARGVWVVSRNVATDGNAAVDRNALLAPAANIKLR